nr:hypothetical protein [Tanacetum cinerariifolium]
IFGGVTTFFLGLQVKQKPDGIFISQDKYVTEILKKYGFLEVKNASTPMETQNPLLNDEDGEEVDVHMYMSMIGSLMYLTSSRPDIMFAYPKDSPFDLVAYIDSDYARASLDRILQQEFWTTAKARTINGEGHIQAKVDGKKVIIFKASIRRDLQFGDEEGVDCFPTVTIFEQLALIATNQKFNFSKWIFESMGTNLDNISKKFLMYPRNMGRVGKGFSGRETPLFPTMVAHNQEEMGEDEAVYKEMYDSLAMAATTASSLEAEQDNGNINKTQSKATPIESSSQGNDSDGGPRCQDTMGDTTAQTRSERVSKLFNDLLLAREAKVKNSQAKENNKVGLTTKVESSNDNEDLGEDASKQERIIAIDADKGITLVSTHDDEQMFDADQDLGGEEVFFAKQDENVVKKEVDAAQVQVSTAATTPTISIDDVTLAQALVELKHIKPKAKAKKIVFYEPKESTTTTTIPKSKHQDKGKVIMIEEPVKLKKKDQIMLDEEVALKLQAELQAEFDKEQMLAREKT